jgi:tripartite-type tricarboxylate transporter receptor subunit TctC
MARQIAQVLPDYLGQKVIVQAVTGAVGGNAVDTVQRSKPDGRTMGILNLGTYIALSLSKRYSWDIKDLPVLMTIDAPPYGVMASPKSPYSSYEDLLKMGKEVTVAIAGSNFAILPLFLDFQNKGIKYKGARFKGAADANVAVMAGNADLTIGALSIIHLDKILAGDLRPLWVYDTKRFPAIPNVPTHIEIGMPREWAQYRIARVILLAPGTPEHIQQGLKEGLTKALKDERTIEWSKKVDTPVDIMDEEACRERIRIVLEGFKQHPKIVETFF